MSSTDVYGLIAREMGKRKVRYAVSDESIRYAKAGDYIMEVSSGTIFHITKIMPCESPCLEKDPMNLCPGRIWAVGRGRLMAEECTTHGAFVLVERIYNPKDEINVHDVLFG